MSQGLNFEEIRNEAIEMFYRMPDNVRQQLYDNLFQDPSLPPILKELDDSHTGRVLWSLIPRPRNPTPPSFAGPWVELNNILATVYLNDTNNGLSIDTVELLYRLIHQKLLDLGQLPIAGDRTVEPPDVPWLATRQSHPNYEKMMKAAGLTVPAAAVMPPPTVAGPAAGTGGRRRKTKKTRKQRKQQRKSRKH